MRASSVCFALISGAFVLSCSGLFEGEDPVAGPSLAPLQLDGTLTEDGGAPSEVSPGDTSVPPDIAPDGVDGGGVIEPIPVCSPACPNGYLCHDAKDGQGPRCLPHPDWACLPCTSDAQCLGGSCANLHGEGLFCAIPCAPAGGPGSCGPGFTCTPVEGGARCMPDTESCTCHAGLEGKKRACGGAQAACKGEESCTETGWSICDAPAASEEICDGLDNDCDGLVDEGLAGTKTCTATAPEGSCEGPAVCKGAAGWQCQATPPAAEVCDGIDNDCDGETDEPWFNEGKYVAGTHCGVCGNDCTGVYPNGFGSCNPDGFPPHCVLAGCQPGYVPSAKGGCTPKIVGACAPCLFDADCGPFKGCVKPPAPLPGVSLVCASPCGAAGCEKGMQCISIDGQSWCLPTAITCTCNQDNAGQKRSCSKANQAGLCGGIETCTPPDGWVGCTAKIPAVELCNGLDDDCDGKVDEDVGVGTSCVRTNAFGTCKGTWACGGSAGPSCGAKEPGNEVCNGVDDDCDGATDEGFADPATGAYLHVSHCGGCGKKCPVPAVPNAVPACVLKAGGPACGLNCKPGFVDANGVLADGCECSPSAKTDDPDGSDKNCDGVDGDVAKAVFVAKIGNDLWPGTAAQPLRTIPAGVALAAKLGRPHVYVGAGAFLGNVELALGVSIYGGFAAKFATRDPSAYETLIVGIAPAVGDAVTMRCKDFSLSSSSAQTLVDGLTIMGAAAKASGRSSYALLSDGCDTRLKVRNCRILAGKGAPGAAGAPGYNGAAGVSGSPGAKAFDIGHPVCATSDHNPGGGGGARLCGATEVSGGAGGTAICPDFAEGVAPPKCSMNQDSGQLPKWTERGKSGAGPLAGGGGQPGGDGYVDPHDGKTTQCKMPKYGCSDCVVPFNALNGRDGLHGGPGSGGAGGAGCGANGVFVGGAWTPAKGQTGLAGSPGSGGGGGGAAGGIEVVACFAQAKYSDIGGSGGGGGSGGCAGTGGQGGQGGGAAMAVFVVGSPAIAPVLEKNVLVGGQGGPGGSGGSGGYGGVGGVGGAEGPGAFSEPITKCASHGGRGGNGGHGGHGGGGGGGCGGPSVLLGGHGISAATAAKYKQSNQLGDPGAGGGGGGGGDSAAGKGSSGSQGAALGVYLWP